MNEVKRVLIVVLSFLIVLLGVVQPSASSLAVSSATAQCYVYDGHHHSAAWTCVATERGPPRTKDQDSTSGTVDRRSNRPSARSDRATPPVTYGYDNPRPLVQVADIAMPTEGRAQLRSAALSSQAPGRVATNTADRVVIGKMADITADGAIGSGERTLLNQLPDLGSVEANWAQNERVSYRR